MANLTRRQWLKVGLAVGGMATFALSYRDVAKRAIDGLRNGTSGKITRDRIFGNALIPEAQAQSGWQQDPQQVISMTQCFGCWTQCGIRVRVESETQKVLRIAGNPYHPLSHEHPVDSSVPFSTAMEQLTGESGLDARSTACARGATLLEGLYSPLRILEPMKRVGRRGEGKWQRISFEQLINEVTEGGDLFGEGHVDGLRAIHDPTTPLDPEHPGFGPKSNQLLVTNTSDDGRDSFLRRFALNSFGSKNFGAHGAYCGLAYRAGSGALMGDLDKNPHVKPDWDNVEFALFMGTSPAQSGNPFKRQARQLASARLRNDFQYVVVAPALPLTTVMADDRGHWLPVIPGSDSALAMAMIRWIIENQRYNAGYLAIPGAQAMRQAGEKSWTNATHLVITDELPELAGQHLTLAHLRADGANEPVVIDESQELVAAGSCSHAQLFVSRQVTLADGRSVTVKSGFLLLKESAGKLTLRQYSQQCGVPEDKIVALAQAFTRHGRKSAVISHGGMMAGNGFYNAWAVMMLNALIGNLSLEGGVFVGGGKFNGATDGPRYNMESFPGKVKPKGLSIARSKTAYESSEEYRQKVAAGVSPFPAKAPWYPFVAGQLTELLSSALEGYPYPLKAWISNMTNPFYGIPGLRAVAEEKLKDPQRLPLFIAIDAFMNETTALADYIVPDTHNFESWGFSAPWAGVASKATTARWPVVPAATSQTADGQPVSMESFCIAVAKRLNLPGFGENAISDAEGHRHPLNRAEDYYLRIAANIAFMGKTAVAEATQEDVALTGVSRIVPLITQTLKADEARRVAFIYSRGGRFAPDKSGRVGNQVGAAWEKPLQIWNADVAAHRHAITGERYSGCPAWYPARLSDGRSVDELFPVQQWPLKLISFKSNTMASASTVIPRLHHLRPTNLVALNPLDGKRYGLAQGDRVRITTPGGEVEAAISLLSGVMPGVIAVEHGYGHREMGAAQHTLDGEPMPFDAQIKSGINLNDLGFADPTRQVSNTWLDWVSGASVRQGLPARIERIA
ncbi:tetrathionate reductase subunit TtrA [Citrobacter amalonaticus]|uniref:Tetrathionate reductase subunit TtrA n=1 Tax=Citrobacter amalonaticus TaxID=35703 RepID=A0A2S4RZ05_CITAM|nr:tetrathionate reductase subunit TtrA [Citrobacter amalonaticus]POT57541.1 tetrathionate reductase subunit TtrA [Citrobacter amalonaticus]POT76932.1 tetrathionate reductase subunit TtrA [Citrobacter amalonaticus]POU66010.1 tetrathionate reductase subunit TtrA [Citrobacter amalonaticus]POV06167.1 tetrathionate reductase subunit TtrA [Citrobacter amalonaticus]